MIRFIITQTLLLLTHLSFSQQTEKRNLTGFSGIQVARSVDVVFTQSTHFSIQVETDMAENLSKITTEINDETLIVSIDKQFKSISIGGKWRNSDSQTLYLKKAVVYISAPQLSYIKCSSSGNFSMTNTLKATDILLETSSSGDISGNIDAKNVFISASSSGDFKGQIITNFLEAKASSSGDIVITGSANKVDISASSSGDFKGKSFTAKEATLQASSSGDITLNVVDKLKAQASSSGSILYDGNPTIIDKKTSSSGSISKI